MKLLVSDFDGTYFTDNENILKNNQKIHEFRKKGNLFMLSSGRSFKSLKNMCQEYKIEYDYLSCCDGSILYDKNDNIIVKYDLNDTILKKFLNLTSLADIERIQYSYPDDYYKEYQDNSLIGCNIIIENEKITKEFMDSFNDLTKKFLEFDFLCYTHANLTYFCLKNKGINKSKTISYLKQELKLKKDNIYTVGDNENDYAMLKLFKGYYIGICEDKIKKVCIKGYHQVYELIDEIEKY